MNWPRPERLGVNLDRTTVAYAQRRAARWDLLADYPGLASPRERKLMRRMRATCAATSMRTSAPP